MTKILIVKIAAIGDVVMALPLLSQIRSTDPMCYITWICGKQVEPLLKATGLVDRILSVDEKRLLKGNIFQKCSQLIQIWIRLAMQVFDLCLIAHPDPRYRFLTTFVRCKEKRSLSRTKGRMNPVPGRYHAAEYLRLLTNVEASPVVFPKISCSVKPEISGLLDSLKDRPIVVIAPGGAKNILADDALRRWPIESYASLMKELSRFPIYVVVTGSESDLWVVNHFSDIQFINLIGKLELFDLIGVLKSSQLLITHDSGPLHLSKLADCPTIGLFGPTNPYEKTSSQEKIKVLWGGEKLPCRPCYDGKTYAPCMRNDCLINIRPERVCEEALSLLGLK